MATATAVAARATVTDGSVAEASIAPMLTHAAATTIHTTITHIRETVTLAATCDAVGNANSGPPDIRCGQQLVSTADQHVCLVPGTDIEGPERAI